MGTAATGEKQLATGNVFGADAPPADGRQRWQVRRNEGLAATTAPLRPLFLRWAAAIVALRILPVFMPMLLL